jgi:hypothetical protein
MIPHHSFTLCIMILYLHMTITHFFLGLASMGAMLYFLLRCFSLGTCFFWYCSRDYMAYRLKSCAVSGFSSSSSLALSSLALISSSLGYSLTRTTAALFIALAFYIVIMLFS